MNSRRFLMVVLLTILAVVPRALRAQAPSSTAFTYQGQLKQADQPVTGKADMMFELWSTEVGGDSMGTVGVSFVDIVNGLFQVQLDFGLVSLGEKPGWLEVTVEFPSGAGNWTTLGPRQAITAAPFALTSLATVGVDGHSLDAADGSPTNVVYVDNVGHIRLGRNATLNRAVNVRGGLEVFDDDGAGHSEGISFTSNVYQFNELAGETPIWDYYQATDTHRFYTGDQSLRLTITSAGNVGVGTPTPSERLHVADGNLRVDGNLQLYRSGVLSLSTPFSIAGHAMRFENIATGGDVLDIGTSGSDGAGYAAFRNREGATTTIEIDADRDDTSNAVAEGLIKLRSTGGGLGGQLSIGNDDGATRIQALGGGAGGGGTFELFNGAGAGTVFLDGDDATDGSMTLRDAAGHTGIKLWADHAASVAGEISLYNDSSVETVEIIGAEGADNGGQIILRKADGTTTIQIDAEYGTDGAGYVSVNGGGSESAMYLESSGASRNDATLRVHNTQPNQGMAAYLTNNSTFATMHVRNDGTGETLWLENTGGGDIIVARDATRWQFWVDGEGVTNARVVRILGGADLSEGFDVGPPQTVPATHRFGAPASAPNAELIVPEPVMTPQPGMVVSIDPANPGKLVVATEPYDRKVAGIISGAGGVNPGMLMGQSGTDADGDYAVALTGRVYCKCVAANGPIEPGDLLTSSGVPGFAMKVSDHARAQGAVIGKAMTALSEGEGLVLALVSLQ